MLIIQQLRMQICLSPSLFLCHRCCWVWSTSTLNSSRDKWQAFVAATKTDRWRGGVRSVQFRDCWNKVIHGCIFHFHHSWRILLTNSLFALGLQPMFLWRLSLLEKLKWGGEFMLVNQMLLPTIVAFEFQSTPFHQAFILYDKNKRDTLTSWSSKRKK